VSVVYPFSGEEEFWWMEAQWMMEAQ